MIGTYALVQNKIQVKMNFICLLTLIIHGSWIIRVRGQRKLRIKVLFLRTITCTNYSRLFRLLTALYSTCIMLLNQTRLKSFEAECHFDLQHIMCIDFFYSLDVWQIDNGLPLIQITLQEKGFVEFLILKFGYWTYTVIHPYEVSPLCGKCYATVIRFWKAIILL